MARARKENRTVMVAAGIIFGLIAATLQSLCYLFSRTFVARAGYRSSTLFAMTHSFTGLFALIGLPFCWSPKALDIATYWWPLCGTVFSYLAGQVCFFAALKWAEASRLSPLLGLKILVLTLITVAFLPDPVTPLQWLAVGLCLFAAVGLNYSGVAAPWASLGLVLAACVGYSLSDISIVALTRVLAPDGSLRGIFLGVCLSYVLAGIIGAGLLLAADREERSREKFRAALPVGVTWFLAMICLYVCFNRLNALFGNIVQSLRGPISILMGAMIASRGHVHVEARIGRGVLFKRLLAALLMCAAIALFAREKARLHEAAIGEPRVESGRRATPE